jgi:hypothetical protein
MSPLGILAYVFLHVYVEASEVSTATTASTEAVSVNGNIQFLWATPLEKVHFFSPDGSQKSLVPDWMRADLNKVALALYKKFINSTDTSNLDRRNAESIMREFKKYQVEKIFQSSNGLFNSTVLMDTLSPDELTEELKDAIQATESFRVLVGKVATDFTDKMMFHGGTKFFYQARIWAEVFDSGDAILPHNYAQSGAFAAGLVFTNLPPGTMGKPSVELLDPRGHNPPFGKDESLAMSVGTGYLYPGWVNRMTKPHRCCSLDFPPNPNDLLTSHRIDWAFEIGLFQYPEPVLQRFYDLERCPFQDGFRRIDGQLHFNLEVEELVKLEFQGIDELLPSGSTYNN